MAIANIAIHAGSPALFIDGRLHPPCAYYSPIAVAEHVADMVEAGVDIFVWGWGTTADHGNDLGWLAPGRYDYSRFDAQANAFLALAPNAWLIPRLVVSAPEWWLEAHPDDRLTYHDGTTGGGIRPGPPAWWGDWWDKTPADQRYGFMGCKYETSMASLAWRQDAAEAMSRLIRHMRAQPYAKQIIGLQLMSGGSGSNEWFYTFNTRFPDYSPAAIAAWRRWAAARYAGDIAALRDSWNATAADFATLAVPSRDERLATDMNLMRDPAKSRRIADYCQFLSETSADAVLLFCRAAKAACDGQWIVGAAYGYVLNALAGYMNGHSSVHWGHQALRKVLDSPDIDWLWGPYQYFHRGRGGSDGQQSLTESVKLAGKLWMEELDQATFVAPPQADGSPAGGHPARTREQTLALMTRDFAQRLIRRTGMWWFDPRPAAGWYHHPGLAALIRRTRQIMAESQSLPMRYQGEVAVFVDEETPYHLKPGVELLYPLVFLQDRLGLARMGTTYDLYLHNDLARPNFPDYKLLIFLDTLYLTESERRDIARGAQRDGKTVLWMYAPGFITEQGFSIDAVRELTGMRIDVKAGTGWPAGVPLHMALRSFDHPITHGVPPATFPGSNEPIGPVFYCDDPAATALGQLLPVHGPGGLSERPIFAVKEHETWTSIFCGVPNLPAALLRNIARFAGCHIYADTDDIIYANSHYLCLHAASPGTRTLRLPRPADVQDALTGQVMARATSEFAVNLPFGATGLYRLTAVT